MWLRNKSHAAPKAALLCECWGKGFGVAAVVEQQAQILCNAGWNVDVYCHYGQNLQKDLPKNLTIVQIPLLWVGTHWIGKDCSLVISHTAPFHSILASLNIPIRIAWDHGEPPEEFFPSEKEVRRNIRQKNHKAFCSIEHVVSISNFIRSENNIESSIVLANGADHLWQAHPLESRIVDGPIRILCVSRFSGGERKYKGFDDLAWLASRFGEQAEIIVAGRGSKSDKQSLQALGLYVECSVSDQRLAELYASCDVLVSFSKWEGFNLPLVECGFFGTPGYALDYGAHKEVTPFVFSTKEELYACVQSKNKDGLRKDGLYMREWCQRFTWAMHREKFLELVERWNSKPVLIHPSMMLSCVKVVWKLLNGVRKAKAKLMLHVQP